MYNKQFTTKHKNKGKQSSRLHDNDKFDYSVISYLQRIFWDLMKKNITII